MFYNIYFSNSKYVLVRVFPHRLTYSNINIAITNDP